MFCGVPLISTTSYHPFGPPQGWTWGNGDQPRPRVSGASLAASAQPTTLLGSHPALDGWLHNHIRLYDSNGKPSRIQGSDTLDYSYDAAQRLTQIAANDPKYNQTYGYNALDQLLSVAVATGGPIPGQTYQYDKLGNRTSQIVQCGKQATFGFEQC